MSDSQLALWEVFTQEGDASPHVHAGSVHAADAEMALENARDVYTRRGHIVSIWVVPSALITASQPQESSALFEPARDKIYRHPQFYKSPKGVKNLE